MSDTPAGQKPDRRRHAWRDDLADERLRGAVEAPRYVAGEPRQVIRPVTALRAAPQAMRGLDSEILFGERVIVFDEADGWAWVQLEADRYVGYTRADGLSSTLTAPTHQVRAIGTFVYPEANIKSPPLMHLSLNARLTVTETRERFAALAGGGYVMAHHIAELSRPANDFVEIAERLTGTPYLWGGKTRIGLDCSGLVQIAMQAAGVPCPRDSDLQLAEVGEALAVPSDEAVLDQGLLRRGDLVFWPGHVGIMVDGVMMLHANGHNMSTVVEPVVDAATRIRKHTDKGVVGLKRPTGLSVSPAA